MAAKDNSKKAEGIISLDAARKNRNSENIEKEKTAEYTVHVPEVMDKIAKAIEEYKKELEARKEERRDRPKREIDRGEFICLLSGISTCRRMPGIPQHMGYRGLYQCQSAEDVEAAREHLEEVFNIHDEDSMKETLWGICVNHDYRQFESFWEGHPAFDTAVLKTRGRSAFESAKACAEKLSPMVGKNGFLAWDINEQIGMCRKVYACGLISQDRFIELTVPLAKKALQAFQTWEEYAISCLCGAVYFGYRNHDSEESQWNFFELNKNILESLLADDGAWGRNQFKPI